MARTNNNSAKASKKKTAKAKTLSEESMAGGIALSWYVTGFGRSLSQAQRKAMSQPAIAMKVEDLSEDLVRRRV